MFVCLFLFFEGGGRVDRGILYGEGLVNTLSACCISRGIPLIRERCVEDAIAYVAKSVGLKLLR